MRRVEVTVPEGKADDVDAVLAARSESPQRLGSKKPRKTSVAKPSNA